MVKLKVNQHNKIEDGKKPQKMLITGFYNKTN